MDLPSPNNRPIDSSLDDISDTSTQIISPQQMMAYHARRWQKELDEEQRTHYKFTLANGNGVMWPENYIEVTERKQTGAEIRQAIRERKELEEKQSSISKEGISEDKGNKQSQESGSNDSSNLSTKSTPITPTQDNDELRRRQQEEARAYAAQAVNARLSSMPQGINGMPILDMPGSRDKPQSQQTIVLGINTHTGKDITITDEERVRQISVAGATGTHKSTLLTSMALQAAENGESVIVFAVERDILDNLLVRFPQARMNDVVLLDFSIRDRFIGINHLAEEEDIERYIELFKRLWNIGPETPNLENTLRAALLTLQYNNLTLDRMPDLLRDKVFRASCIANIPTTLPASFVRDFWEKGFYLHNVQEQIHSSDSTLNKVLQFLMDKYITYIVAQNSTTLNVRKDILDNKRILLIHLSKQDLQPERVRRIGAMLLEEVKHALFSRADLPIQQRHIVNLICDEWQLYVTPDFFEDVLSQGRRYGISTVLATQTLANFDDKLQAILDQVGTHITFAVGIKDANKLAIRYARDPQPETEIERKLGIVREPIEWLLTVKGGQDDPVIDRFTHERLTIFSDAIKESHHAVAQTGGTRRYGPRITHISVPVSELDLLRRELNRIFYEMMIEKNPRKVIPVDIFFQFASSIGFAFPLLHQILLDPHAITARVISPPYNDDECTTGYQAFLHQFIHQFIQWKQASVDATAKKLQEMFPLVWTSRSNEEVKETVRQIYQESYTILPAWERAHFHPYYMLTEEKHEIEKRCVGQQKSVSEDQAILSAIEGQNYKEWLRRDNQWKYRVKSEVERIVEYKVNKKEFRPGVRTRLIGLVLIFVSLLVLLPCIAAEIWLLKQAISVIPPLVGMVLGLGLVVPNPILSLIGIICLFLSGVILFFPLFWTFWAIRLFINAVMFFSGKTRKIYYGEDSSKVKLTKRELAYVQEEAFREYQEEFQERMKKQGGVKKEMVRSLESELRAVQKTIQEEKDRLLSGESRLVGTEGESALQQEIRDFAAFVFELREFMEALADDPPLDTSRWKEKEVVRRQHADMIKEKEKELLQDMPDGIAYVAMRMRGGRFTPRMKTKKLEPIKEGKRFLNTEEIATLLQERRVQALKNAEAYTTEAQKIDEEFWKRRQRFGIAPSPVVQPAQEEEEHDTPVPVSHAKRRTKEFSLSLTPQFHVPDTASNEDLLMLLYLFGYLDIESIARLVKVEKKNTNNLRSNHVKPLVTAGLVEEQNKPQRKSRGAPPLVYSLTNKGRETLGKKKGFTPSKAKAELGTHLINLNDLLVSAVLLSSVEQRITLAHFEHEYLLKQRPIPIENNKSVAPDGFVSYSLSEPYGETGEIAGICYEWDEGSETPYQLRDKFTDWVTAASGAYRERFGTDSLTIAFCCQDEGRATKMVRLAEQVLTQNRSYAELFLFGAFDPATTDPLTLMTTTLFKQPFESNPHSLIEKLNQEADENFL